MAETIQPQPSETGTEKFELPEPITFTNQDGDKIKIDFVHKIEDGSARVCVSNLTDNSFSKTGGERENKNITADQFVKNLKRQFPKPEDFKTAYKKLLIKWFDEVVEEERLRKE